MGAQLREELLAESDRTRVLRVRQLDGTGGAIYKKPYGPTAAKRLRHERSILERLASVEGVQQLALSQDTPDCLVLEDSGGIALDKLNEPLEVAQLLRLAEQLAAIIAAMHRRGVVHRDINPANIVVSGPTRAPLLIDFDLATTFADEHTGFIHQNDVVGTLAYLAPEQTGRTSRGVDQRADLYAFGATLYMLAAGRPPFGNGDPLQLVHDHLGLRPIPPAELNTTMPHGFSNIILRLLEKEPDARYQSAEGLTHDLSLLRARYARRESTLFRLGERDFPARLSAPSRLIGRDKEIGDLRTSFENALHRRQRAVLISGAAGVGKTALINELRPFVAARGGWFVSGKYDQYRADAASGAFVQALRALGRMLLAEPEQQLAAQRADIVRSLGNNAGVITALVPEFALLLGTAQPEISETDSLQSTERLFQSSVLLLRAIATPARPVVMVLDDLQWAGAASMDLVNAVLTDQDMRGLLLVGAYREAEVDPAHPLSAMLSRWNRLSLVPQVLRLQNLPLAESRDLLVKILRLPPVDASSLAVAIRERTDGNPYDTIEFINALRHTGALTLGETGWNWDVVTIRRHVGQSDVVALVAARIERLPVQSRVLLEIMACLGGDVELSLLRVAAGLSAAALEVHLAPALEDGLLMIEAAGDSSVRFRHDRVQQAALSRLLEAARTHQHLQLARRLIALPELQGIAAEQYLAAIDAVDDPDERRRVAGLFGKVARDIGLTNYSAAERFLAAAMELLGASQTVADDPLVLLLLIERHAGLFRLGRLDEADVVYREIARRCENPVALAASTTMQVSSLTNRSRQAEAGELGLQLLSKLGLNVPQAGEFGARAAAQVESLSTWLNGIAPAATGQDTRLPGAETHDPSVRAAARILTRLLSPGLFPDPQIRHWLALESQRLWAEHGPCPAMVANLGAVVGTTIALRGDYRTGYIAARYGLAVGEQHGYEPETSVARYIFASTAQPWFEPLEDSISQVQVAREGLISGGDLRIACLAYNETMVALFESAPTLDAYAAEVESGLTFAARTGNDQFMGSFLAHRQLVRALRGETEAPGSFADHSFNEAVHVAGLGSNRTATVSLHVRRALSAVLFGDAPVLAHHAAAATTLLGISAGRYVVALTYLLRALAIASQIKVAPPDERANLLAEMDIALDWMAQRAKDAPYNFLHLLKLMEAERAWATGEFQATVYAFEAARSAVERRSRPWHAAIICERAGLFHLEHGLEHAGRQSLAEALSRYAAWGAAGKVKQLERAYPFLRVASGSLPTNISLRSSGVSSDTIDLMAVVRASQALTSETNSERLRMRVVEVLSAMTGATGVRLLFWSDDAQAWFLPPRSEKSEAPLHVDEAGRLGLLSLSAFRYAERTREPLLIQDATLDDRFSRDPYLARLDHCSLLVVPILARGTPRAMLLIENRLSRSAFSADRLDSVMLIAGQLAVSLDNALAERFRSLVQRSSDLTLVCDRAGMLSYASPASAEILGIEDTALTGRAAITLVHVDDRVAFAERTRGGSAETLECRAVNADGSSRWVEASFTDLSADAAVGGVVVHLRDITERRRLEGELRQAQKLESVGQLSAGIAHELNTPIQVVDANLRFMSQAFTDMAAVADAYHVSARSGESSGQLAVAEQVAVELDTAYLLEEVPRAIAQTLVSVARMATIVRAMKAFGDPHSDTKALSDLNEAVRTTLVVAESEIKYVADVVLDLGILPLVWCNVSDINQVVLNLVVNAAQAIGDTTGERGTISVRTFCEGEDIILQVQDTGVGIAPEIAERVFEQFFTTRGVGRGTGQGLAVAYKVVHDRHSGSITFTSEPGVGTIFSVRLPQRESDRLSSQV